MVAHLELYLFQVVLIQSIGLLMTAQKNKQTKNFPKQTVTPDFLHNLSVVFR